MKAKNETKVCITCGETFTTFSRQVECPDCCWVRVTARLSDPKAGAKFTEIMTRERGR
jgi:DNA-directed RNA polymerase subunit RPC12/RpoP